MASLVPLPASGFKCSYNSLTTTLKLSASGTIPGVVLKAFLERDALFFGGLKFSLLGYWGGLGNPPPKELETSIEEHIALPSRYIESGTVVVQTASGTYNIQIQYENDGVDPAGDNDATASKTTPDKAGNDVVTCVIPTVNEYLPGGDHLLAITAAIPTEVPLYRIDTKFNEEYLRIDNVTVTNCQVAWRFKWEKFPVGEANPQLLEVITEGFKGSKDTIASRFRIVQGYIVHGVLLK